MINKFWNKRKNKKKIDRKKNNEKNNRKIWYNNEKLVWIFGALMKKKIVNY